MLNFLIHLYYSISLGHLSKDQDLVELDSLDELTLFGILLTMEILVVVAQHKHQYYSRISKSQDLTRLNSSPPNKFRAIHCQTSHAADGFIPPPLKAASTPLVKQTPPSKKTPASPPASDPACMQPSPKSIPIPIIAKSICNEKFSDEGFFDGSLSFSERWAGPTYSNSPSPSSLPIPKFLQLPTSSHSLGFPNPTRSQSLLLLPQLGNSAFLLSLKIYFTVLTMRPLPCVAFSISSHLMNAIPLRNGGYVILLMNDSKDKQMQLNENACFRDV
ncbi:hypothetical protein SAY87_000805 [Trapa incisa]|uniref:Uncharacterized protein n=1 Tax=Trapa incisa TaxID=236973 RepID=A0AAN7GJG9_9MYRT|nr:hypothetical protein SAY87_000805 [Trapa incisa]